MDYIGVHSPHDYIYNANECHKYSQYKYRHIITLQS